MVMEVADLMEGEILVKKVADLMEGETLVKKVADLMEGAIRCIHSLDWTTGLEYWTGQLKANLTIKINVSG